MESPTTCCIIGAGPAGIALAYQFKKKLKCDDFVIVDQNDGPGGTWYTNTYPGCGCDVPSHFYSFSFALNANWSKPLCEQSEILGYMNDVVDRFGIRSHLCLSTAALGASWDPITETWEVQFRHVKTGHKYTRRFQMLVTACGIFSRPKYPQIPGMETFQGCSWHTGSWDESYEIAGKKVAVIGNGCSGCQVIPAIASKVKEVTHFARSKQWLFPRPNPLFSSFTKWAYRNIPGLMWWHRFQIYWNVDKLYLEYIKNPQSESLRAISEKEAREYMIKTCPPQYLDKIMPDYPVGCKRRVLDPGYLASLGRHNVDLCDKPIAGITETGVELRDGSHVTVDAIVYATGFYTQEFLAPMEIKGQGGKTMSEHWKDTNGSQAYLGTTVSGFPNFAIMFGPNASPAHNSVIYTLEVQAEYIVQTFLEPLLTGRASTLVIKRSAEDRDCNLVQTELQDSVWHAGCTNWTLNENGRNCTSFPGYVRTFWWKLYWPRFQDYIMTGGTSNWIFKYLTLKMFQYKMPLALAALGVVFGAISAPFPIATIVRAQAHSLAALVPKVTIA